MSVSVSFRLSEVAIAPIPIDHPGAGGFVVFEGKVRNHAGGQAVVGLEYEAYPEMAIAQGERLLEEARERFELLGADVVHRVGALSIGETAVVVQVAAAHRREAFEACEWIMDQLKWRVPIWKREAYAEGPSEWVHAGSPAPSSDDRDQFTRQIRLPQVGEAGQARLQASRVLIVGVGGLGSGALPPLVGAGIGTLGLVDPDLVERSNLHRQTLYGQSDVGRQKVERAAAWAKRLRAGIQVHAIPEALSEVNAETLVGSYDWVVDGTDSLETKFLLNAVCRRLGKPLVTASVHQFEGQVMTVFPDGPCLQCLFPESPPAHCVGTCAQSGVLGVAPLLLGAMQANEVLKGVLGLPVLREHLVLVDLLSMETLSVRRTARANCPGCAGVFRTGETTWELTRLDESEGWHVVDIREPDETPDLPVPHERVPMAECYARTWDRPTVFVCASGQRSYRLVADLRARGVANAFSLAGGRGALRVPQ